MDKQSSAASNNSALATIISVFFFWGFVAASNGLLIPVLKNHFTLSSSCNRSLSIMLFIFAYGVGSLNLFSSGA
jgi:FHS family L-fucose permease-like MFS transporter